MNIKQITQKGLLNKTWRINQRKKFKDPLYIVNNLFGIYYQYNTDNSYTETLICNVDENDRQMNDYCKVDNAFLEFYFTIINKS